MWLPLRAQLEDRAMQDRADIRFAEAGKSRYEPVIERRAVLECDQLALPLGQLFSERCQAGEIGAALGFLFRRRLGRNVQGRIEWQVLAARSQVVDAHVMRNAEQPGGEACDVLAIAGTGCPGFLERARGQILDIGIASEPKAEVVEPAGQLVCVDRIPVQLFGAHRSNQPAGPRLIDDHEWLYGAGGDVSRRHSARMPGALQSTGRRALLAVPFRSADRSR